MGEIESLAESCRRILDKHGRLSTAIPGFVARAPQATLAEAIAGAIEQKSLLIAEAGTGTGKTFAYLLPSLLSKKKVLISTATKTLQDQLFHKDIPTLVRALGISASVQNLKGRSNYICQYRVNLYAEEGHFQTPSCIHEVLHVKDKLPQMKEGDRSELPEINEESPVWYYVTSNTENCLGVECPNHDTCFLIKARKKALKADVVVINHHLFFADSRLKQEGFGELLPGVDVVIFDEAHQLAEIALHFNEERIGSRQFIDLLDDVIKEWPVLDLANQPLKTLQHLLERLMDELVHASYIKEERMAWKEIQHNASFIALWAKWLEFKSDLLECLSQEHVATIPGLVRCKERLQELERILAVFTKPHTDKIKWLERLRRTVVFHATPFDVANIFMPLLKLQSCAYVFTSATLTMANSFDCFCKPLGLDSVPTLLLPSPFNYKEQALLYLPRGLPDPKDNTYYECLLKRALPIIKACGGRCFLLFTSHRALKCVAEMLANKLPYPLLVQGTEAKPILLARFRQLGNAVLLGTATFWEGVDVKGDALSCVIIDKLPFASPADPVISGRMAFLKEKGLSAFDELTLPQAVIALKQGVGRLIRDITDKGVLMIADPRLSSRDYGRDILASLPSLPKTRDEQKVLKFIEELALDYETISA